jgi:CheY-like chemotaxis protein
MIRNLFVTDFEEDFDVEIAVDGTQGLAAAAETRPDVILLDINMPDISGIEVTRELSRRKETAGIPVIIITASEYNDATEQQLRPYPNFRGFLSKITPTEKIRKTVDEALG